MASVEGKSVVRLSLRWVLFALVLVLAVGAIGGMLGQQAVKPRVPLLNDQRDQIVTTVQEVSISPSQAAQQTVKNARRSVLLLARSTGSELAPFAIGSLITNDGLVASVHKPVQGDVFAIDDTGTRVALSAVGTDVLFGITYYRVQDAVIAPLDFAQTDPDIGMQGIALSRSVATMGPVSTSLSLSEFILPAEQALPGVQRLAQFSEVGILTGTPIIDDTGMLTAIMYGEEGQALPISTVRASLDRITAGTRERNPYDRLGFEPAFVFGTTSQDIVPQFRVVVSSIEPKSPAASALRVGDVITTVGDEAVTWSVPLVTFLSDQSEPTLTIQRGDIERTITLREQAVSPTP